MILYFIIGCCIGSFLCLTAQRIPLGHSIIYPRSHCVNCKQTLAWYELIPLVSILVQRFRCRHCYCRLPVVYFTAELFSGTFCVWFFCIFPERSVSGLIWLLSALLLSMMDYFHLLIEACTLYLSWFFLWIIWIATEQFQWISVCVAVGLGFLLIRWGHSYLGVGDSLLLLCWSGGLSLISLLHLVFTASFLGLAAFSLYYLRHQKKMEKLPFVPFLSIALLLQFL